ncbi:hypothetical protein BDY21DRAFT_289320, partial [Lineolata rhizophorae]
TGLLGREVVAAFQRAGWKTVATGLSRAKPPAIVRLDLLRKEDIERVLADVKPDVVVHCAANRSPDSCAADPAAATALNTTSAAHLAALTSSQPAFLLHISTDYVFSGRRGEAPYGATAAPSPPNAYGRTKAAAEAAVLQAAAPGTAAVLRVPVLYGRTDEGGRGESAVGALVDAVWRAQDGVRTGAGRVRVDHYAQRYPTCTEDVARVCVDVCDMYRSALRGGDGRAGARKESADELPRILHFSAEDRMTKFEMCVVFADILGLPTDGLEAYVPSEEELRNDKVVRPYDCHLDTAVLRELGIGLQTVDFVAWWRRELRAFRR